MRAVHRSPAIACSQSPRGGQAAATALAVLRLCDAGELALDNALSRHLPGATAAQPGVTLRGLLCHAAGLPLDVSPRHAAYAKGLDWPALGRACLLTPIEAQPRPPRAVSQRRLRPAGAGGRAAYRPAVRGGARNRLVLAPLGIAGYLGDEPSPAGGAGECARQPRRHYNRAVQLALLAQPGHALGRPGSERRRRAGAGASLPRWRPAERSAAGAGDARPDGRAERRVPGPDVLVALPVGPRARAARGGRKPPHWVAAAAAATRLATAVPRAACTWYAPSHDTAFSILGARTADSGWLLRRAPAVCAAILARE